MVSTDIRWKYVKIADAISITSSQQNLVLRSRGVQKTVESLCGVEFLVEEFILGDFYGCCTVIYFYGVWFVTNNDMSVHKHGISLCCFGNLILTEMMTGLWSEWPVAVGIPQLPLWVADGRDGEERSKNTHHCCQCTHAVQACTTGECACVCC